jgi:hypothetical protein
VVPRPLGVTTGRTTGAGGEVPSAATTLTVAFNSGSPSFSEAMISNCPSDLSAGMSQGFAVIPSGAP